VGRHRKTKKEREKTKLTKERQMERKYTQKVYRDKQESNIFSAKHFTVVS
jgi:hypothetical protein